MELYLDSVDQKEIEAAFRLGFLAGLTTTPTFMHRSGVTDIDGTILKLAKMVPVLQIEALGQTAEEIVAEAHRLISIGMDKKTTVFKIPVSLEGLRACRMLTSEGLMVNVHLVYTLQQAYMAMAAGATYVCPLVGRLQDQGHDALELVRQCVDAVNKFGYKSKIMFSSVRHAEHVRNAINIGVHTITVPWSVMKKLTDNNLTQLGTDQFFEHTALMTIKVEEVVKGRNPLVNADSTVSDALVQMSQSGLGAATVVEANGHIKGIFTDGDLRRLVSTEGTNALTKKIGDLTFNAPLTITADSLLINAVELIKKHKVDNLIVADGPIPVGMLDVQDLVAMNLIS
jgi:TalC/MipB family fructose-6-phosphate aldolase